MLANQYREILREELTKRCQVNKSFSLRAFSRFLGIEPAQLSRVLGGKKNISPTTAKNISELLFEKGKERELFVSLVEYATAKNSKTRETILNRIKKNNNKQLKSNLELEAMRVVSDWYHIAILDMTYLSDFDSRPTKIASFLGITEMEAKLAIDRLLGLGLLQRKNGRLVKTTDKLATPTNEPSIGIRSFHKQMISKALKSIDEQKISERYIVGKTFTVSKFDLPKLKELTEKFKDDVSDVLTNSNYKNDSLYQLNIQLFNLENSKRRK